MSPISSILDLEGLARKVEYKLETLNDIEQWPIREDYHALETLCHRFSEIAVRFSDQIDHFKDKHVSWSLHEGSKTITEAKRATAELIANGQPRSLATFRRNFTLIFDGPKESALDSRSVKSRNKLVSSFHGLRHFLQPTTWAAGSMKDHVFDHLIESIEPAEINVIPPKLGEILRTIGMEEPLSRTNTFQDFINDLESSSHLTRIQPRKRKRAENDHGEGHRLRSAITSSDPLHLAGESSEVGAQAAIEAAFLVPSDVFEEIWNLRSRSIVQEPHTIILTIPVERRVASVVISIPRAQATQFSHQFRLPTIFRSLL